MAQATSYGQQGAQDFQQAQQAYGQHGGNSMMNQGENYNQGQSYAQGGSNMTNSAQGQNYAEGQNSSQGYYNQRPNEMNESAGQQNGYGNYQTTGMNGQAGQSGAQYPDSKAPDTLHVCQCSPSFSGSSLLPITLPCPSMITNVCDHRARQDREEVRRRAFR
jgi:hypothetical protein